MKIFITIRFYEELNGFLPLKDRKKAFELRVDAGWQVKQVIETCGVPCPQVDLILVNGRSVDLSYTVRNGDRISVYPVFERMDVSSLTRLPGRPLRDLTFICDVHLGRLAKYLRMLGFDTLYQNDYNDDEIQRLADEQARVVLTRDRRLLKNKKVTRGCLIREMDPRLQLENLVAVLDLAGRIAPLSRCLKCNGVICPVSREKLKDRIDQAVLARYDEFFECKDCRKIYWKGSHYDSMMKWIRRML